MTEDVELKIIADTTPFAAALDELQDLAGRFGSQLTGALRGAAVSGKALDDVLRRIGLNLAGMALDEGLKPLRTLASGLFSGLVAGFADVKPFAAGGVVSTPTYFPTAGGMGLMGEAGAEAILPLRRSPDGRLGVAASGGGTVNITFNVTAQDAASFRKSEAQVTGMLARAVTRGARGM